MVNKVDFGVVGLAVMGANLALNLADSGNQVVVYNRTRAVTDEFVTGPADDKNISGGGSLEDLVAGLSSPRALLLMVKAGAPVDAVISSLVPLLDAGDIIIDGGNLAVHRHRTSALRASGRRNPNLSGMGVSGGEEGARYGPSLMPGGDPEAWPIVSEMLTGIAAIAPDGVPCADWLGAGGAGHFVKMVHNGIEYGDMQVIAEAYDLKRRGLGMDPAEIGDVFEEWNSGRLKSYLVEITADILRTTEAGEPLIDKILDAAGQKGTGKWTVIASMNLGEPAALVAEAVYGPGHQL